MASIRRKDEAAAQEDTGPANAGGGDPSWATYAGTRRTQVEKLHDLLETPIAGQADEVGLRMNAFRASGLIKGRS
eukprot:5972190-Alexandrium_andersonii.AAC.1